MQRQNKMTMLRDIRWKASRAPATVSLIVLLTVCFILIWAGAAPNFFESLRLETALAMKRPWSFFTYPLFDLPLPPMGPIGFVFAVMWLWSIGTGVEQDLGAKRYLAVWLLSSIVIGLAFWVGAAIFRIPGELSGAWAPIAALSAIWGTRNASAEISFFFAIPAYGRWIAWLAPLLVFFSARPLELGLFAALGLIPAYMYGANKLSFAPYGSAPRGTRGENAAGTRRVYKKEYYDEVKRREQDRADRERLRKLFEQSARDDPEDKNS